MGKGSSPRNIFSNNFRNNYDDINWNRDSTNGVVDSSDQKQGYSTIEGVIRQLTDNPLESAGDWGCDCDCDDQSCAKD